MSIVSKPGNEAYRKEYIRALGDTKIDSGKFVMENGKLVRQPEHPWYICETLDLNSP